MNLNYKPELVVDTDNMPYDEWLKWRTSGIGGSDVAAIYEVSGWTTKRALYFSKIGLSKKEDELQFQLEYGHAIEPFVAKWFEMNFERKYKKQLERELGEKIRSFRIYKDTNMYRHPLYPFMQANLDYRFELITYTGEVITGIFECKSTSWHIGPEKWGIFNGIQQVPQEYVLQCRHYMSIMNEEYTIIACLWGNNENDYVFRLIRRDYDEEEEMIEMESDFWFNNVQKRIMPALSQEHIEQEEAANEQFNIYELLKKGLLPELTHTTQDVKEAIKNYQQIDEKRLLVQRELKRLESSLKLQRVILEESLKGEPHGKISVGKKTYIVSSKESSSSRIDSDKLKEERPDIAAKYQKISKSKRFSVREEVVS